MNRRLAVALWFTVLVCILSTTAWAKTTVDYWYSDNNQVYWDAAKVIVDKFNQSQDEVTVNLFTFVWNTDMQNKLLAAIAGGTPPDVVALDGCIVAEWVANLDPFTALDPYLARYGITKQQFIPNEWREGSLWGKQWSLPWRTASRGLYYNKDLFGVSGLNADKPPVTLEEVDQFTKKITRVTPEGKLDVLGFAPWLNNWNTQGWFWAFGGNLFDWESNKYTLQRPEHLKAFNWIKGYAERYGQQAIDFAKGFTGNNERFFTGQLGMILQSTTYLARLHDARPDMNYGVAKPPQPEGGANGNWGGGFSHVIPISAKNKDGAALFMAFLAKPDIQLQWYELTSTLPTHWEAVRRLIQITPDARTRVMIEGLPTTNARTPYWLTVHKNLLTANSELITGKKPPEQILAEQQQLIAAAAKNLVK